MSKILRTLFCLLTIFLTDYLKYVKCDQPKFIAHEGDFVFQSAQDKNITLRLSGDSRFLINDINVLDSIQKVLERRKTPSDEFNIENLSTDVQVLKTDIQRFTNRLRRLENGTSSLSLDRVRALRGRLITLTSQFNQIITELRENKDCLSNPCKNGGTCYNLYKGFYCLCPDTWTGSTCELDVDECKEFAGTDLGCQNNGVCINLPGSYRCNCTNGFIGAHCRDRVADCSKTLPGELCGKGQCIPANNTLGYQCICDVGWKKDNITQSCTVDVDECVESLVSCHTSCINLPGSFACGACPDGYTGNGVICRDINECENNNGGCSTLPKVMCINTEGSYRCGNCPPGWTGDGRDCSRTETYSCESTNICHPLAKCEYISNVMVCSCPEGLTGSGYGRNGCRSGSANPCNEHNCQNGGTCVNRGGIASCVCPRGFEQPHCEIRNPCLTDPCLNGGTCLRRSNSNETTCNCLQGFFGKRCQNKRDSCGSVLNGTTGELIRPTTPGLYEPNQTCAWIIRTRPDLILNVTFSRFDLQIDPSCGKDWLQINDGKSLATPVIGRFCGPQLPKGGNILSSHNFLFLWFHTDDSVNGAGFSLNWTSVAPICGGRSDVDEKGHGIIKSPGYPGKSPPNRECEWEIVAPLGKRILLRFFEVVMEYSDNCTRDALLIYDDNELMEKVCQTGIPLPKHSSTNIVRIYFHTDSSRQDSLFQMHYEVVDGNPGCGGLITEPSGKILFTLDQVNCLFLLQQPPGTYNQIAFSVKNLQLGTASFKIYDGNTEDDPLIFITNGETFPGNISSTGSSLLISVQAKAHYAVNPSAEIVVFEADFKRACGQTLENPLGGEFTTPNYPNPYYEGLNCQFNIEGPINSVVLLIINDFDLSEYPQGCDDDSDYIDIFLDVSKNPNRFCKGQQMHMVSPSNYLYIDFHSNKNPQGHRGISATYRFEEMGCGGILRETKGSFERLDSTSPTHTYCQWILEAPESNVISLDLTYKRIGTKCAPGEVDLKIYLNSTENIDVAQLAESHCGDEKRIFTTLPASLVTVFLKLVPPSVGNAVTYGITANYTYHPRGTSCGGNYSLLSGSIMSPGWPKVYYDSMDCVWVINAPLGNRIELIPKNFTLESNDGSCRSDYLEIRNGMSELSPLIGKFCGSEIPPHIPSFTNHLYLKFHSDSTVVFSGFDITFQQTSTGCGGSLISSTGSIASPHYPALSPGPVQCDWKITISQGSSIDVFITRIGPTTNLCSNDVLTIYDGPDGLAKKLPLNCSSNGDIILKSSKNKLLVRYVLPDVGAAEDQQFYLEYKTNCKQTLNSFEGVIESPNFPKEYPNKLDCEWTVEAPKSDTISLSFSHFELESRDEQCVYDMIEIIDMKGEEVLQSHKFCRNLETVFTSDGNKFVIKFKTDNTHNGNGFRLEYKRNGCGGYKTVPVGWLQSPNYPYSVDVDCEWFIEAPPGMQIVLDVVDIQIEGGDGNCSTNGLIVKNDKTDTRNLLRSCRNQIAPSTVTSHGNKMYIKYFADSIRSRKYFKGSFKRRQGQCGGIIRNTEGEIASPNYPENYPSNIYCEWIVNFGNEPAFIEFSIERLEAQNATNCFNDLLNVYYGLKSDNQSKLILQYCPGTVETKVIDVGKNILNVIFNSEDQPPGKGFVLKYKKKSCGSVLTKEIGTFGAREENTYCTWLINMKPEHRLTLTLTHVECNCYELSPAECAKSRGLTISNAVREIYNICEEHPADIIIADTSLVVFVAKSIRFTAKYNLIETACGGALTSRRGSLASPFYPESYPSNVECIWTLSAPSGNYLELNFNEMNISSSENCNQDYLELRESTSMGRMLGVFCSNVLPTDSLQGFERIWIKFRSSEGSTGKGFRLSWTNAQLNEIRGFKGKIRPPPIASIKSEKEPYQWRITVPRDSVISLTFKEYNLGLMLYDGFDNSALPIEIKQSPWQVTSSTNVVYLISDNQMLDEFIIEWKAILRGEILQNMTISDCNETMVIGYETFDKITSPGYPNGYEPNLKCEWLIQSDNPTRHVAVNLDVVRLEKLDDCYSDSLRVLSSNNLMNWHEELKVCDSSPKPNIPFATIHGTPNLKLVLTTDGSINKTGFSSHVFTVCGSNLTDSVGRILEKDVTIPGIQKKAYNCTWHIEVGSGRKIKFTFDFPQNSAQNSSGQCDNYALIRDGLNSGAPILPPGRICSSKDINGSITTTTNRATLKYVLKFNNYFYEQEYPLWNITYREYSECSGEVRLTSYSPFEVLKSPNYPNVPNAHTECVWLLIAPPGETVQVQFVDKFDMNVRQCSREFIEFRDGGTEMARLLGKHCTRPPTIRSSGNVLYMRYLTDIAEPRNGFKANVSLSTCGGTFTQFNNLITSSNYPAPGGYPANTVCEYVIKVSTFSRLNLTFLDVDLPFDAANLNNSDQIRIYQVESESNTVNEELAVIYGNTTSPPAVQTDTNEVLIRFYSFKANSKFRGFKIKYDRIFGACFRDVSGDSGSLTLNIAPRRMAMFLLCRWKITVPKGRRVKLDITDVDGAPAEFDPSKKITFYNDFQMWSRITALDFNNITKVTTIRSSDNKMFIRIFGAHTTTLRRVRVEYSSDEESNCPEDITSNEGSLSNTDLISETNFFCSFDFELNGAQTMSFSISNLVVETRNEQLPSFALRFKNERYLETLRVFSSNTTNTVFAISPNRGTVIMLQNEAIRIKNLYATFKKHPCGGTYNVNQRFEISMPNITVPYENLDCAWQLRAGVIKNGYNLRANFSFELPCEDEFVTVHAGPSNDHTEVAKFCRGQTFNMSRLYTKQFYVYYHTKSYSPNSQMQIVFEKGINCGGTISMDLSVTEYLLFTPADYKNNLECVWLVQAMTGFFLQVQFSGRFFIEDSKDCVKDYLEISKFENINWVPMPRYCGRNLPSAFNTSTENLRVIFRSDNQTTGDGFTITIKMACYAEFNVTNQIQVISYPHRWSMTKVRMTCDYILQSSDPNKHIKVVFKKLALGYRERCALTQITAQKQGPLRTVDMGPYCKDNAVRELRAKNQISLHYQAILETGGYEIEFSFDNCGGDIKSPTWISSLKNEDGDGYADDMNCVWNISAPVGYNIGIWFKYLVLEENTDCSADYVSIYKGSQIDAANMEANLCGNFSSPLNFHIEGNTAVVRAISDSWSTAEGFSARIVFSKACDERLSLTVANTPVEIERNLTVDINETMNCYIRAMAPPDFRIEVELKELNLGQRNKSCGGTCESCEYLEVIDSLKAGSEELGRYCAMEMGKLKTMSSFKDVIVRTKFERPGIHQFKLNLRLVPAKCAAQNEYILEDESNVLIESMRGPNGLYPPNTHCNWKITSKKDFVIKFSQFSLQNTSDVTGKCVDYVLIRHTGLDSNFRKSIIEHCGTIPSFTLVVEVFRQTAVADITFHTDESIESTGFTLTALNLGVCNRTYTHTSGLMSGTLSNTCINEIILPENYNLNFYIPSIYLSAKNCSVEHVRVFDIKKNVQIYEDCSDSYSTRKIMTSTNQVRLSISVSQSMSESVYYYASPPSPLKGCGGNLDMESGYIMSPDYQEYKNSSVCRWNLTTPDPNRIKVFFYEFNMGSVCKTDYLNIIEVAPNGTEYVARRYCEQESINSYTSESNTLSIVSVATKDFDGSGWLIYFRRISTSSRKRLLNK